MRLTTAPSMPLRGWDAPLRYAPLALDVRRYMKNQSEDRISVLKFLRFIALELYLLVRNRFGQKYIKQLVMDGPQSAQLQLIYVMSTSITTSGKMMYGGDFNSLVWLVQKKHRWVRHAVITKKHFQGNYPTGRWVSEVHSFDSVSGTAIIQVAENDQPRAARTIIHCNYSWRNWDLIENSEIDVLQRCRLPAKKYRPTQDE